MLVHGQMLLLHTVICSDTRKSAKNMQGFLNSLLVWLYTSGVNRRLGLGFSHYVYYPVVTTTL